jgi:hypothetical protein
MSTVSFRLDFGRLPRERGGTTPVVYEVTKRTLVGHWLGYNGVYCTLDLRHSILQTENYAEYSRLFGHEPGPSI